MAADFQAAYFLTRNGRGRSFRLSFSPLLILFFSRRAGDFLHLLLSRRYFMASFYPIFFLLTSPISAKPFGETFWNSPDKNRGRTFVRPRVLFLAYQPQLKGQEKL